MLVKKTSYTRVQTGTDVSGYIQIWIEYACRYQYENPYPTRYWIFFSKAYTDIYKKNPDYKKYISIDILLKVDLFLSPQTFKNTTKPITYYINFVSF